MVYVVILGYRIFREDNSIYKSYLDNCLEVIKKNNPDKVVLCGGFTNKEFLDLSEAMTMANYLIKEDPALKNKIILEEKSITTLENLRFAFDIINKINPIPDKIIFCSDSIRVFKVFFIASSLSDKSYSEKEIYHKLMDEMLSEKLDYSGIIKLSYENLEFIGLNMDRNQEYIISQIPKTMLEIAAIKYPDLEDRGNTHRKQKWGLNN